ncbi:MAG: hypothetical protein R3A80_09165 [Bdellovibrionota bacterium]
MKRNVAVVCYVENVFKGFYAVAEIVIALALSLWPHLLWQALDNKFSTFPNLRQTAANRASN